jgi:hypothetical protein
MCPLRFATDELTIDRELSREAPRVAVARARHRPDRGGLHDALPARGVRVQLGGHGRSEGRGVGRDGTCTVRLLAAPPSGANAEFT